MNKRTVKLSALILSALIIGGAFAACGGPEADTPAPEAENTGTAAAQDTAPEEETGSSLYTASLGPGDYSGEEFRVYTSNSINGMKMVTTLNHGDEETGEVVNDSLVARDRWLEETYGVKLSFTVDDTTAKASIAGMLNKIVLAGDDVYDAVIEDVAQVAKGMTMAGTAYAMSEVPTADLGAGYWMPEINEQLKIGGSTYFTASAISPRFYGSAYIIMFNRDLANNLGINDLYDLVSGDRWTIDRLMEYSRLGVADIDGDGQITGGDQAGMFYEVLTPESLVMGAGYHYVENRGGSLEIMLEDQGLITYMDDLSRFFQEEGIFWTNDKGFDEDGTIGSGNYLFFNPCTFVLDDFRDLDYDYGILPMPKKDEAQQHYISYAQPWVVAVPVVPVTIVGDRLEMTGVMLNAMAAYGYDYLRPAVFENVIQLKGTRDQQSEKIVDQLFDHVTFELAAILRFGSFDDKINAFFCNNLGKQDIASLYASLKSAAEGEIASVLETYAGLEDARKG